MKKIPTLFLFYARNFWVFQTGLHLHSVIVLFLFLSFSLPSTLYAQLQSQDSEKIERLIDEGNFKEVIHYINTLDSLQAPGSITQAHSRLLRTLVYREMGKYIRAEAITDSLLRTGVFSENKELLARAWMLKGIYSILLKKDETALQYYLKVDSLTKVHPNLTGQRAWAVNNIGELLFDYRYASGKYNLSSPSEWYKMALPAAEKAKDSVIWYRASTNLAFSNSFKHGNMPESVPEIFPEAINYYKKHNKTRQLYKVYHRYALLNLFSDSEEKALKVCEDYINYMTEINRPDLSAKGWGLTGTILNLSGKYEESIKAIEKGIKLMDDPDAIVSPSEYLVILTQLAEAYKSNKQYKEALEVTEQLKALNDTIIKTIDFEKVKELETRYQTDKKEQEISMLKAESALKAQQQKYQRSVLLGIVGIACLVGFFFFLLWRNRQKTNKKLMELDGFKSRFFANISHEFRTPLTLITAPVDRQLENTSLKPDDELDFKMIRQNSNRLLNLVDQLLDLSKLESGHWKLKVGQGNLNLLLLNMAEAFRYSAKKKKIDYHVEISETGIVWFDRDIIEKILINLLSNAFKYTPNGGIVSFSAIMESGTVKMHFENNGVFITNENLERLFERFYQSGNSEGSGIGLALVKELATLSHGQITAERIGEDSLRFTLILPVEKKMYHKEELLEDVVVEGGYNVDEAVKVNTMILTEEVNYHEFSGNDKNINNQEENSRIMLIVEDNRDLRKYIYNIFSEEYMIIEAENGQAGIDKAIEIVPDIVISDIMMPGKSGLELCETLKTDSRTSHIPIVLLTAKTSDEDNYTGLQTGANDYIAKPFKTRLLKQKVKNIIESRERIRERYSQELVLVPKDLAITSVDETFLEKIKEVLHEQITFSTFSSEEFSKAVGMSRMQLHRKLKALTGLSTSEFIRSQRLILATDLLKRSDANISEIGYTVGFSDPSYFSKCFKETYHCTPTEYAEKIKS